MKLFTLTTAAAVMVTLAGCTTDSMDKSAEMAKPDATVVDSLIGKSLVNDSGNVTFKIMPNGIMGGSMMGEDIVGVYKANAKEICSTYSAPKRLTGREYCSI